MKEFQDIIFISEILLQSKIAQRAFARLQATHTNFDRLEVWCSIQSILVSAANISKILWPNKKRVRGKRLREILKVEADNILSNRKFRNHFEHYDERIEEWFTNCPNGVYIDLAMNTSLSGGFGGNDHRGYTLLFLVDELPKDIANQATMLTLTCTDFKGIQYSATFPYGDPLTGKQSQSWPQTGVSIQPSIDTSH